MTGLQTMPTVIIIEVLTRPGKCDTCSVGQVISTLKAASVKWMKLGCVVPAFPLGHSTPSSGWELVRAAKSRWLMGFEPKTFWPTVQSTNHYTTGASNNNGHLARLTHAGPKSLQILLSTYFDNKYFSTQVCAQPHTLMYLRATDEMLFKKRKIFQGRFQRSDRIALSKTSLYCWTKLKKHQPKTSSALWLESVI